MLRAKALLLLMLLPGIGFAQGLPVIDSSAIAAAQANLDALKQQLDQLKSLVKTTQSLANAVGQAGATAQAMQQSLSQSGLQQFSAQFNSALTGGAVGGLSGVLGQIGQIKGVAATPDLGSFANAQQWVSQSLTSNANDSATLRSLTRQARQMVAGEAVADGYALALTARQQLADLANRSKSLAGQVSSAGSLRDDIAANSAVMLAIHDAMAEIQALLSADLAVQSSQMLLVRDGS